jgi:phosphatidylglycerophosphate synthase
VSANAVTLFGVGLAAVAGVLLSLGRFGPAAVAMGLAALGDALDGQVARRSRSVSVGGALLDASADRYEEFLLLGGLAVLFRDSLPALVLTLLALLGSYMVSYGSAKAEALARPIPAGMMRRPERAVCLFLGAALAAGLGAVPPAVLSPPLRRAPLLVALAVIAVVANVSALRRLRALARSAPEQLAAAPGETSPVASAPARVVATRHALRIP